MPPTKTVSGQQSDGAQRLTFGTGYQAYLPYVRNMLKRIKARALGHRANEVVITWRWTIYSCCHRLYIAGLAHSSWLDGGVRSGIWGAPRKLHQFGLTEYIADVVSAARVN